jgi:hypothetical protein
MNRYMVGVIGWSYARLCILGGGREAAQKFLDDFEASLKTIGFRRCGYFRWLYVRLVAWFRRVWYGAVVENLHLSRTE